MKRWILIGAAVLLVAVVAGPYVYFHFVEGSAPAPLTLASASSPTGEGAASTSSGSIDGTWEVASGSVVGYRVNEVLFGQTHEAVGRTSSITGSLTLGGTSITAATFTVDMTTVTSDQSRRDEQFDGRIMEISTYPTATFKMTEPIASARSPPTASRRPTRRPAISRSTARRSPSRSR